MALADGITRNLIAHNRAVVANLALAQDATQLAFQAYTPGEHQSADFLSKLAAARMFAADAVDGGLDGAIAGLKQLGPETDLLTREVHWYAKNARSRIETAVNQLRKASSASDFAAVQRNLEGAAREFQIAVDKADTALESPQLRYRAATESYSASRTGNAGPVVVDGHVYDELGNTPRGHTGSWIGPDGDAHSTDGFSVSRESGGSSFSGPDGDYEYDGI